MKSSLTEDREISLVTPSTNGQQTTYLLMKMILLKPSQTKHYS